MCSYDIMDICKIETNCKREGNWSIKWIFSVVIVVIDYYGLDRIGKLP